MEANQFVKSFGWNKAKEFSQITIKGLSQEYSFEINTGESVGLAYVNLNDLKRLIEAHEIIGLFKSLDHAKAEAKACEKAGHSEVLVKLNVGVGYISLSRVKQAIADVESCQ